MNHKQRTWLENAYQHGGSFVKNFALACLHADQENFEILEPILEKMMNKYPKYLKDSYATKEF